MAKETTYEEIVRNIKNKVYSPIYFLMGEEDYYIDRIADYIMDSVLNETEKEFNQTVLYGADTDIATIINGAKRYPMMSKYQVLVVKEAQNLKNGLLPAKANAVYYFGYLLQTWIIRPKKKTYSRNRKDRSSVRIKKAERCTASGIHRFIFKT